MHRTILSLIALSLVCSSCREGALIPPVKVGTYYDITFATKPEGMVQVAYRVVAIGAGSWVQVETYDNPGVLFAPVMVALASDSGKNPQELEREKKEIINRLKAEAKLKWINLQTARMVAETDPKSLGFLVEH